VRLDKATNRNASPANVSLLVKKYTIPATKIAGMKKMKAPTNQITIEPIIKNIKSSQINPASGPIWLISGVIIING
jgi:hypothetical protein